MFLLSHALFPFRGGFRGCCFLFFSAYSKINPFSTAIKQIPSKQSCLLNTSNIFFIFLFYFLFIIYFRILLFLLFVCKYLAFCFSLHCFRNSTYAFIIFMNLTLKMTVGRSKRRSYSYHLLLKQNVVQRTNYLE